MDEVLHSDALLFGTQVVAVEELNKLYPEYYSECYMLYRIKGRTDYVILCDFEYAISAHWNFLYQLDDKNMTAHPIGKLVNGKSDSQGYHPPMRIGGKMIFSPNQARQWALYDIASNRWNYIKIPRQFMPDIEYGMAFGGGMIYGTDIIFYPGERGAFAKYNIHTGDITYFPDWFKVLKPYVKNVHYGLVCSVMCYQDKLLIASPQREIVIELAPKTMECIAIHRIGNGNWGYRTAYVIPNTDWIYMIKFRDPNSGHVWKDVIVKWNIKTGETIKLTDLPIQLIENHTQTGLAQFVFWRGELYATPWQGDALLRIDLKSDMVTRIELSKDLHFFIHKCDGYSWGRGLAMPCVVFNIRKMKFSALLPYDYSFVDIDFVTGEVTNCRKYFVHGIVHYWLRTCKDIHGNFHENDIFPIDKALDYIVDDSEIQKLDISKEVDDLPTDGRAGIRIYDYVKSNIFDD